VGGESRLQRLFSDIDALRAWLARWQAVCASEDQRERSGRTASRAQAMRAVNPRIIARNHWVEDALKAASEEARMVPFERLLEALREPFSDEPGFDRFAQPAAKEVTASYRTFCGT